MIFGECFAHPIQNNFFVHSANSYLDAAARYYVRKFYNRCYNSINGNELSEDDGQISEAKPRKKLIKKRRDNDS